MLSIGGYYPDRGVAGRRRRGSPNRSGLQVQRRAALNGATAGCGRRSGCYSADPAARLAHQGQPANLIPSADLSRRAVAEVAGLSGAELRCLHSPRRHGPCCPGQAPWRRRCPGIELQQQRCAGVGEVVHPLRLRGDGSGGWRIRCPGSGRTARCPGPTTASRPWSSTFSNTCPGSAGSQ